jgi:hypothetical protein
MPQSTLLFRTVLLGVVILPVMPRQAGARDDNRTASFDERWRAVPSQLEFICGGFVLKAEDALPAHSEARETAKHFALSHGRPCKMDEKSRARWRLLKEKEDGIAPPIPDC